MKEDQVIQCKDCGEEFTFTVGEQIFFEKNNFTPPSRCKKCRLINKQKKLEREQRYGRTNN